MSAQRSPRIVSQFCDIPLLDYFEHLFNTLRLCTETTKHLFDFSLPLINRTIHFGVPIPNALNFFGRVPIKLHGIAHRFERWNMWPKFLIDRVDVYGEKSLNRCDWHEYAFLGWLPNWLRNPWHIWNHWSPETLHEFLNNRFFCEDTRWDW